MRATAQRNADLPMPTRHAEINAIEQACATLKTLDLAGCVLYTTCEPCPMCFTAAHWAGLDRIVFGATIADAHAAGFRQLHVDNHTLKHTGGSHVELTGPFMREACIELLQARS